MMRLFINGLAASAGGGLTYLRNVIPLLSRTSEVASAVLLPPALRNEFGDSLNVDLVDAPAWPGAIRRFLWEQTKLPGLLRRHGSQVLVSAGNFALWNSPVPQILLSRNSLYTSADFRRDVRARRDYFLWADTLIKGWYARQSIARADATVAPSDAFAGELAQWTGKKVLAIPHGFDRDAFTSSPARLPDRVQQQLDDAKDALRILFVSHYNYYRNFETLIRALPLVRNRLPATMVKLFLTCRLSSEENPGRYRAEPLAGVVEEVRANDNVVELGAIPYQSLHHLYRACHIYVSPAYTETFAHPLVEAMSSGLPLVASDLPVHKEICGDAALYFPRFSPQALADCVLQIQGSRALAGRLSNNGLVRSQRFSWQKHVERMLALAEELVQDSRRSAEK